MPMLLFILAALVLAIAGYYTPAEVRNSCMEYLSYPQRLIFVIFSCLFVVFFVEFIKFDRIKVLTLLSILAITMLLIDPDFVNYGDLREVTGLHSNSCVHSGMIFVFCAWGFALFAAKAVMFFLRYKG